MNNQTLKLKNKYEHFLLSLANVTGVAVGLRQTKNKYTDEICIIVFVKKKIPLSRLKSNDIIPNELEGIRIDIQESGEFKAL